MTEDKDILKSLEREKSELELLIGLGYEFTIGRDVPRVKKSMLGLIRKRVFFKEEKTFKIEEPTLGTLDRLSAEWVELAIDEEKMQSMGGIGYAKEMVAKHSRRCAKIVALAVMGSEYEVPTCVRGAVRYKPDVKRLEELTDLFLRSIKPSDLYKLIMVITAISNLGDFVNSIRLMSSQRTSTPTLIEEKED